MLESMAHLILRHRKLVVAVWGVLTAIGGFAAPHAANRLLTTFSIPSSQSYQHNQRIVETFGNGSQNPMVLVFHDPAGDVRQAPGIQRALDAALKENPGARISSYFTTGADSGVYVPGTGTPCSQPSTRWATTALARAARSRPPSRRSQSTPPRGCRR